MTDLDRLLELKLELSHYSGFEYEYISKHNEYQSLYEKLKKAEKLQNSVYDYKLMVMGKDDYARRRDNQKSQEDIEKIVKSDVYIRSYRESERCLIERGKLIQKLEQENQQLKEAIILCQDWEKEYKKLEQDSKELKENQRTVQDVLNAEIVDRLDESLRFADALIKMYVGNDKEHYINSEWLKSHLLSIKNNENRGELQSILKDSDKI